MALEKNMPLLSICIPTYNRPKQVEKQIRILLPQLTDRVTLTVYDNDSTVPVKTLFTDEELSKFRLVVNPCNVGGDANIARCFENCSTKWLWTLSDDDWVKDNSVGLILDYIDKNNDNLFTCFWGNRKIEIESYDDFCKNLTTVETFSGAFTMSYCLYNMNKLKPFLRFYYETITSMFGTLILVLKYGELHQNTKYCFSDINLIEEHDPNVGWNYVKYIRQSKLLFIALDPERKSFYKRTVFRGYYQCILHLIKIDREASKVKRKTRIFYLFQTIFSQGIISSMRYNGLRIAKLLSKLLLKF
ncbi:MAG: glycosyltransferase family 2 protein [Phocaeicola sp.]